MPWLIHVIKKGKRRGKNENVDESEDAKNSNEPRFPELLSFNRPISFPFVHAFNGWNHLRK